MHCLLSNVANLEEQKRPIPRASQTRQYGFQEHVFRLVCNSMKETRGSKVLGRDTVIVPVP